MLRLIVLLTLALPLTASAADWPGFRGAHGRGVSDEKGLPLKWSATDNVAWKTSVPGEGWSSPVVVGNRVYVTTATDGGKSGRVLAFATDTGKPLWDKQVCTIAVKFAHKRNSQATPTPAADSDRVYAAFGDGTLVAVKSDSGDAVWVNRDFPYYSQHGLGASPVLYKDLLLMAFDGSSEGPDRKVGWQTPWDKAVIVALDRATGKLKWKAGRGQSRIGHATPLVVSHAGKDVLVSPAGDVIQGFDPATGNLLWTVRTEGEGLVPSAASANGLAFCTTGFGKPRLKAVKLGGKGDVTDSHVAWEDANNVPMLPSMIADGGRLYIVTEKGFAVCLDARTGKEVWKNRLGGSFSASPVLADGRLYALSDQGDTYVLKVGDKYELLARNTLGESTQASPAVSGGRLFLRTRSHLWCIGKPDLKKTLAPFAQPPKEFAGKFGAYRSPLKFADGSLARTAADWARRREEILKTWHKRLGPWPALVERPTVKKLEKADRDGYTEYKVQVQASPEGKWVDGYLLVPRGAGPFPAVVVPFYEPLTSIGRGAKGRGVGTHDYGLQLVKRGFVTLSIGTPGALDKLGGDTGKALVKAGADLRRQPLTLLAYVAANCLTALARTPEVDPERIGVVGLSYGGKWSMFASCLDERFACAVWSDPGIVFNEKDSNVNYWEPWYLGYDPKEKRKPGIPSAANPRTGLYKELIDAGEDLVDLHALMAPRPVLVSGGVQDPPRNWQALNHLVAVNNLLGHKNRAFLTARKTHVPTAEALEMELAFLEYFLKNAPPKNPNRRNTATRPAVGARGMISTAHPLATRVGLDVLEAGGNAFDAAVAVAATLNVVEPMMSGMGGFGVTLLYDGQKGTIRCLDSSGRFPAATNADVFRAPTPNYLENRKGARAVSTPGNARHWETLAKEYGKLPWSRLLAPAIELADDGFTISAHTARHIQSEFPAFPEHAKSIYGKDGKPLQAGDRLVQKDLARSLRLLSAQGAGALHGGELGKAIDKTMRAAGGFLRLEDLKRNQAEWWDPVSIDYRGCKVAASPLPNNAWNGLYRLGVMSRFDLGKMGHNSPAYLHTYAEATKLAYAARLQYAGDRDTNPPPLGRLLSEKHWTREAARIKPDKALPWKALLTQGRSAKGSEEGEYTTHFVIADSRGNVVTSTQTLGMLFGSKVMAPGTGVWLNNSMQYCTFEPKGNPMDAIAGRRKLAGFCPMLVLRDGKPWIAIGSPGGHTIVQTVPQMVMNMIDHRLDVQQAIAASRLSFVEPDVVAVDEGVPASVRKALTALGHNVQARRLGNAHGLTIEYDTKGRPERFTGGADPRGEGTAMGR